MNWTALWAQLKKLDKKIDDMETITFQKVNELPEVGEDNVIYFVPKQTAEEGNYSDEYIWDSNLEEYEKIGDTMIVPEKDVVVYFISAAFVLQNNKKFSNILNDLSNNKFVCIRLQSDTTSGNKDTSGYFIFGGFRKVNNNNSAVFYKFDVNTSGNINVSSNNIEQVLEIKYLYFNVTNSQGNAFSVTSFSWVNNIYNNNNVKYFNIAGKYSTSKTYNRGDIVTTGLDKLNYDIYYCLYDNVTGSWNASKWQKITVVDAIDLKTPTDYTKDTAVTALYDSTATYELGDIVMYNKELYECTTAIPVAEEWDSTHWTKTDIFSKMPSGGGALSALSDVDLTNPSDEQDLVYNATLGKWINKTKVVTLTKAQYDALPSSKLTDGIMYYITDLDINDYAKDSSIADLYDNTSTYAVGDIVMFENELYKCTTAVSVAEDFDVNKWTSINVMDIISASITSVLNTSF